MDNPGALLERHFVPRDHPVLDLRLRGQLVERSAVAPADELLAAQRLRKALVGIARDGDPLAVVAAPVLCVGLHRGWLPA